MSVTFEQAAASRDEAVKILFGRDERVQAVGICHHGNGYGIFATRNRHKLMPYSGKVEALPRSIGEVPIVIDDDGEDLMPLLRIPVMGPHGMVLPEQQRYRHIVCGIQVQSFDQDDRDGVLAAGFMRVGTLGCFVEWKGHTCLLSNEHVLSPSSNAVMAVDRIFQPGTSVMGPGDQAGILVKCGGISASAPNAHPADGTAVLNTIDAALAVIPDDGSIGFYQQYLSHHPAYCKISGAHVAHMGEQVFKIGRTTGLTQGVVTGTGVQVGPFGYDHGPCWFNHVLRIKSTNPNHLFSDSGDSGSAIVNHAGMVVGLLFGGGGPVSYAIPIATIFDAFTCKLI